MSSDGGSDGEKEETRGQILQRHKKELREMKARTEKLLHSFNKKDKAAKKRIEEETQAMERELQEKHAKELAAFDAKSSGATRHNVIEELSKVTLYTTKPVADVDGTADGPAEVDPHEVEVVQKKLNKTQRRKQQKLQAEIDRERALEEERRSAPNPRAEEDAAIRRKLAPLGLTIREVQPDGHCMYRAIADQLQPASYGFLDIRKSAADFMRAHPDDFAPFIEADDTGQNRPFEEYCNSVEHTAAWGGQLELRAVACALPARITVVSATAPPVQMGTEFEHAPHIHLSYHHHAYGLGEHYNAVVPIPASAPSD